MSGLENVAESRLRRQRAMLADFGLYAFRTENLDELLNDAARRVSDALEIGLVKILEWRPETRDFLVRAGVGWKPGVVGHATIGGDDASPAGHALARREPVISPDTSAERRFRIPKLLSDHGVRSMVNVIIAGNHEPFGVLEVDAVERREFDEDDIAFLRNYANLLAASVERLHRERTVRDLAEQRRVLVLELQHRVKNMLALVQSLAVLTSITDRTAQEFREALIERLHALARAHALLSERQGHEVDLDVVVERLVEPYCAERPDAVVTGGERVVLESKQALTLGLIMHELCTNAAKYGALSAEGGKVRLSWRVETREGDPWVRLTWQESGGPPVVAPGRKGFGTSMIERAATYELAGEAEIVHRPEGLSCVIDVPLPERPPGRWR